MGRITSHDVARLASVSQSAVSRTFTPGASVSRKTLDKVLKAADSLGYRPNVIARSLITGKTRIIGFVVAYFENQFYADVLEKLARKFKKKGYHLLVFMAANEPEETEEVVEDLISYQVDGIIAASLDMSPKLADACRENGIHMLLFNRHQGDGGPPAITSDNIRGGRDVARFLLAGGHRRIAHISGWQGASTGRDRMRGFMDELQRQGVNPVACLDGMYNREAAVHSARELFAQEKNIPDAVFVGNDHMAFAVMDLLRHELGLRIPEDVSVVGYDDVPLANWSSYDLTTVRQPINQMVGAAVDYMLQDFESGNQKQLQMRIRGDLVVRNSARIPKDWQ